MKRFFYSLAVLSVLMHLAMALSPLWAQGGDGFQIEICSGDRWEIITIDENGNEVPHVKPDRTCSVCLVQTMAALDVPEYHQISSILIEKEERRFHNFQERLALYRIQNQYVRGPPTS